MHPVWMIVIAFQVVLIVCCLALCLICALEVKHQKRVHDTVTQPVDTAVERTRGAIVGTVQDARHETVDTLLHEESEAVAVQQTIERSEDGELGSFEVDSDITYTTAFTIGEAPVGLVPETHNEGDGTVSFELSRDAIDSECRTERIDADELPMPSTHDVDLDDRTVLTYRVTEYSVEPGDTMTVGGTWQPTSVSDVDFRLDETESAFIAYGTPDGVAKSLRLKMIAFSMLGTLLLLIAVGGFTLLVL